MTNGTLKKYAEPAIEFSPMVTENSAYWQFQSVWFWQLWVGLLRPAAVLPSQSVAVTNLYGARSKDQ